ncbi:MAG: alpha/beta hydrolase [Chthoniobacterales bacterium]
MSAFWKKARPLILLFFSLILCASSTLLFIRAPKLWIWGLKIFATEWSWIFLLVAILIAILANEKTLTSRLSRAAAIIAAIAYLIPVIQAVRVMERYGVHLKFDELFQHKVLFQNIAFGAQGQHIDFYPSSMRGKAPCVIIIHGGGWRGGNTQELSALNSILSKNGYAVASVSYRLSPGASWPAAYDDVVAALTYLRANAEKFNIDPDQLVVLGRSAGGQLAADIAVKKSVPGICGCICFYAPLDMVFGYGIARENDILHSPRLLRDYLGGTPKSAPKAYHDASPYFFIAHDTVPFLLVHGTRDDLVWVRHSERFADRLKENGVSYHMVTLPWSTHAFDFPPLGFGRIISTSVVLDFLHEVCKFDR